MSDERRVATDGIELDPTADSLYAEGCALVAECDVLYARSINPRMPEDYRNAAKAALSVKAAKARSRFKRHDARLDTMLRREADERAS